MFVTAAGDGCSERLVGIELGRLPIRHELLTPGLLHLRSIRVPQRLTQQLQALEDRQGLDVYTPDVQAFRAYAQQQYLQSPVARLDVHTASASRSVTHNRGLV